MFFCLKFVRCYTLKREVLHVKTGGCYTLKVRIFMMLGEFKHEVRQFQKPYDNQQAEQISLMV